MYIIYTFNIQPITPGTEILIAELSEVGFDSFEETGDRLKAYIEKSKCTDSMLDSIYVLNSSEFNVTYNKEELEDKNWNEEWESNFSPITICNRVQIRATFHEKEEGIEHEIIIDPKMSFGTGHHATTNLMINMLLDIEEEIEGKEILDMGCGTGVLSIMSEKLGAKKIDAIDIDEWSYNNSKENIKLNNCDKITVKKGDVSEIGNSKYDIILANINRNVLLADLEQYKKSLNEGGSIILSGFYKDDERKINTEATRLNLRQGRKLSKDEWLSISYNS